VSGALATTFGGRRCIHRCGSHWGTRDHSASISGLVETGCAVLTPHRRNTLQLCCWRSCFANFCSRTVIERSWL